MFLDLQLSNVFCFILVPTPLSLHFFIPWVRIGQKFGNIHFSSCNRFGCVLANAKIIGGF